MVVVVVGEDPEQPASASVKAEMAHTAHPFKRGPNFLIMRLDRAMRCEASGTTLIIFGIERLRNRIHRLGARSVSSRSCSVRLNTIATSSE